MKTLFFAALLSFSLSGCSSYGKKCSGEKCKTKKEECVDGKCKAKKGECASCATKEKSES
jgi:hypothetical protein